MDVFPVHLANSHRYLSGFISSADVRSQWLAPWVAAWEAGIHHLARVVDCYPQAAFASLTMSFQLEWQYTQWVLPPGILPFHQLGAAIANIFLQVLFGGRMDFKAAPRLHRSLLALLDKNAGYEIPDP